MKSSDVKHLADLAYITVSEERQSAYENDFKGILEHIDSLQEISEEVNTLPTYYHQTLREDQVLPHSSRFPADIRERILQAMPSTEHSSLVVKTVLKK
jgi:aspartyl/glutamyl-tRNA(Asn/Gln) amidotransferase C subunit